MGEPEDMLIRLLESGNPAAQVSNGLFRPASRPRRIGARRADRCLVGILLQYRVGGGADRRTWACYL